MPQKLTNTNSDKSGLIQTNLDKLSWNQVNQLEPTQINFG